MRSIFSADVLSVFETLRARQRWRVEGSGRWLLVWREYILPPDVKAFFDQAVAIASQFGKPHAGREKPRA